MLDENIKECGWENGQHKEGEFRRPKEKRLNKTTFERIKKSKMDKFWYCGETRFF